MGRPFVVLTFEFVDLCYDSNETSLIEVLHSTKGGGGGRISGLNVKEM